MTPAPRDRSTALRGRRPALLSRWAARPSLALLRCGLLAVAALFAARGAEAAPQDPSFAGSTVALGFAATAAAGAVPAAIPVAAPIPAPALLSTPPRETDLGDDSLVPLRDPGRTPRGATPLFTLTPWKVYHLLGGFASGLLATSVIDAGASPAVVAGYPLYLPAVALSTATAAGIGKEVLDSTGFGGAEFSDILITMAGGLLAAGVSAYVETRFPATPGGRQESATVLGVAGALLSVPVIIAFVHEIVRHARR